MRRKLFDGRTYDPQLDEGRLSAQLLRVMGFMRDGQEWTYDGLKKMMPDASVASIAARIRDLRKHRFGGFHIETKRGKPSKFRMIMHEGH